MPSSKCVLFWFFSIQLLIKHTLNPKITLLYQFHAQKALFKVPKICYINFWNFGTFPKIHPRRFVTAILPLDKHKTLAPSQPPTYFLLLEWVGEADYPREDSYTFVDTPLWSKSFELALCSGHRGERWQRREGSYRQENNFLSTNFNLLSELHPVCVYYNLQ